MHGHICVYVHKYTYNRYIYECLYLDMYIGKHTQVCMCMHVSTYGHVSMHICMYVGRHVNMYVCTNIYFIYACMHRCVYMSAYK